MKPLKKLPHLLQPTIQLWECLLVQVKKVVQESMFLQKMLTCTFTYLLLPLSLPDSSSVLTQFPCSIASMLAAALTRPTLMVISSCSPSSSPSTLLLNSLSQELIACVTFSQEVWTSSALPLVSLLLAKDWRAETVDPCRPLRTKRLLLWLLSPQLSTRKCQLDYKLQDLYRES